jgi:hypothetical protein
MKQNADLLHPVTGQSFLDREGQRWWVKGPRPGGEGQFVVEAEMKGKYPRVAVYAMTANEFREQARTAHFKPVRERHSEKR